MWILFEDTTLKDVLKDVNVEVHTVKCEKQIILLIKQQNMFFSSNRVYDINKMLKTI